MLRLSTHGSKCVTRSLSDRSSSVSASLVITYSIFVSTETEKVITRELNRATAKKTAAAETAGKKDEE